MNILKKKIKFKKKNKILRFVNQKNYADNFGYQWNIFRKTQIDTFKFNVSKTRLLEQTKWQKKNFNKKTITLEAGSGAGRFTQAYLSKFPGKLVSVDLSNAVESNKRNNTRYFNRKRLLIFQADISRMPFKNNVFDNTFCFGVLQHTPQVKKTLKELIKKTKKGGSIVVDFYPYNGFWTKISAKYLLRPIAKRISKKNLLNVIKKISPFFYRTHLVLSYFNLNVLTRFLPICDPRTIPKVIKGNQRLEWIILDTFDMYTAYYDQPQKISNVSKFFLDNKCVVEFAGYVNYRHGISAVVRAKKL